MQLKKTKEALNKFAKYVIQQARTNLTKKKKNVSKGLYKSLEYIPYQKGDMIGVKFYMDDYGTFLDKGVSGNKKKRSFTDYKFKNQSSPYSYTTKGPPIDILSKWIKKKGIKPKGLGRGRDKKTGQFLSGFAYLISKKIKREGIPSLSFFQKPLGLWYDKLQDDFLKEFKKDVTSYITTFTKNK